MSLVNKWLGARCSSGDSERKMCLETVNSHQITEKKKESTRTDAEHLKIMITGGDVERAGTNRRHALIKILQH